MSQEKINDKELIAGIRQGGVQQERMIRYVYEMYFYYVQQGVRKNNISEDDALDAYTDAVMVLRRNIVAGSFRGESKVSTFLWRIFFNKCINAFRKNATKKVSYEYELPVHLQEKQVGISRLLEIKEDFDRLTNFIDLLGEPCQSILIDSAYKGYSMMEIADRIGFKDAQSVRSKKYTCMQQLMKIVKSGRMKRKKDR